MDDAAVSSKQAALVDSHDFAERRDTILKRHMPTLQMCTNKTTLADGGDIAKATGLTAYTGYLRSCNNVA